MPSGSGKTNTVAFHVNIIRPKTFLYVVHRSFLVTQTMRMFRKVCGEFMNYSNMGVIDVKNKEFHKPFLFATIQTLSRKENLEKIRKNHDYVVIDEYHHAAADSYKDLMSYIHAKYFVGLTATPYRLDEKDIMAGVDNNIVTNIDLFEGIDKKILVPFHYFGLHDDIDYSQIKWNGYKYNTGDLDRQLIIHKRDEAVLEEYRERIEPENRKTIAFCNSIAHVQRMTTKFQSEGIVADMITHETPRGEREKLLQRFREGKISVLFTRDILNEGVDFPECEAIMFLRPTISKTIFMQQLGRGLRRNDEAGKKNILVLDYIGNYIRAFEKRKWFAQFSIHQESTGKMIKPLYNYDPNKPVVIFDERTVEMMDIQLRNREQEIFNPYWRTKEGYQQMFKETMIRPLQEKLGREFINCMDWKKYYGGLGTAEIQELGGWKKFREFYNIPGGVTRQCIQCGKDYQTIYLKLKKGFCSMKCQHKERQEKVLTPLAVQRMQDRNLITANCINCDKEFHPYAQILICGRPSAYCSQRCRTADSNNSRRDVITKAAHNRRDKERTRKLQLMTNCLGCGKQINRYSQDPNDQSIRPHKYCSESCAIKYRNNRKKKEKKTNG